MDRHWVGRLGLAAGAWLGLSSRLTAETAISAAVRGPDVREILRGIVARAEEIAARKPAPVYIFEKRSVQEVLGPRGEVRRVKEKLYEVTLVRGMTRNRLVAIDGRRLDAHDSALQSERERGWRDRYASGAGGSRADSIRALVNDEMLNRFEFSVTGREVVSERPCWVLEFKPKEGDLPADRLIDRVINLLRGRIWVDEEVYEVARVEAATHGALRLWGGVLGALEFFELRLERVRADADVWYNRLTDVRVKGRRLFSDLHLRLHEFGDGLRRTGEESAGGGE